MLPCMRQAATRVTIFLTPDTDVEEFCGCWLDLTDKRKKCLGLI
jgi:hypothetical protein